MRLLLVEDDLKIASFVLKGFQEAGFTVQQDKDGETGLHVALHEPFDAAIIDIMLPKLDGLSLIQRLRLKKVDMPVIILSARTSVDDRVKGLQSGDDYLTKPFSFSELLARVQALIRRATGAREATRLVVGDLSLDLLKREVYRAGKEDRPATEGILASRIPDAQRGPGRFQDDDHAECVELRLRSYDERRGGQDVYPAGKDRQGIQSEAHPHGPWCGVCL